MSRRGRAARWSLHRAINASIVLILIGLIGLIVGTVNGSRPMWPAPIVWTATSTGAILACAFALARPAKQTRLAAVLGVGATATLRGFGYVVEGSNSGLRVGAAVGAYMIVLGFTILVTAMALGESLSGKPEPWET